MKIVRIVVMVYLVSFASIAAFILGARLMSGRAASSGEGKGPGGR